MKRSVIAVLALAAVLAGAAPVRSQSDTPLDLDGGVDAKSIISELRHRPYDRDRDDWAYPRYYRTERDCATISFRRDDPLVSERVSLESREYQERCYPRGPNGEMNCHDEWVWTERRHVRVEISGRGEMLPWEEDVFEVCLDGRWLTGRVVDASHEYDLAERGDSFVARAGRKVPALPDPVGIVAESFQYDAGSKNFALGLRDRWSQNYGGDQTVLTVQLKRHRDNWFDETLLEKELSFPAAEAYKVDFARWAGEMNPKPAAGKKYYVKWRFKRVGKVSKDKWQKYWESDRAVFEQAAPAQALFASSELSTEGRRGVCWFKRVERNQCVYRCRDGSIVRRPVRELDPFDRDRGDTIPCPQLVIPF